MGYDTPAAKMFGAFVASAEAANREALRRKKVGADPLNLTRHTSVLNEKQKRRKDETERLARGERKVILTDPDNPSQNVMVTAMAHSLRRVKLKLHQESGAERFLSDWESAMYAGLSSMGFDPRVDSSPKPDAGRNHAVEAQLRLSLCEKELGRRNWKIICGVLLLNWNASKAHAAGARQHVIVQSDIDVALNALAGFYDPGNLKRDPTWEAFERMWADAEAVIKQGKDEVR